MRLLAEYMHSIYFIQSQIETCVMLFQIIFFQLHASIFEACFYMRQLSIYYVKQSIIFDYIQCLTDLKCDYTLSEEFRKNHYLVGLLLQEVKMCMNEPKEVRRHAIHLLRNQIAKHSFDDRYTSKVSSFINIHGKICINAIYK